MRKFKIIAFVLTLLVMAGCAPLPTATPLEIQEMQTREFDADKDAVIAAVLVAWQNKGISIDSVDHKVGFISASFSHSDTNLFGASDFDQKLTAIIKDLPNGRVRLRLNIINTLVIKTPGIGFSPPQTTRSTGQTIVPEAYEEAFEEIRAALFIEGE